MLWISWSLKKKIAQTSGGFLGDLTGFVSIQEWVQYQVSRWWIIGSTEIHKLYHVCLMIFPYGNLISFHKIQWLSLCHMMSRCSPAFTFRSRCRIIVVRRSWRSALRVYVPDFRLWGPAVWWSWWRSWWVDWVFLTPWRANFGVRKDGKIHHGYANETTNTRLWGKIGPCSIASSDKLPEAKVPEADFFVCFQLFFGWSLIRDPIK